MQRMIVHAALLAISVAQFAYAENWTTYLNGNDRVGATRDGLSPDPQLLWMYSAPAPPELAWEGPRAEPIEGKQMRHRVAFDSVLNVAVADGRCYFGSSVDHQMHCVNSATGKPIWNFFTEGPIRLAPTVVDGRVYFGSDDGVVYCLNAADGAVLWQLRAGPADERLLARGRMISRWPIRTGVLLDDGVAYFGAGVFPHETVYLYAVDAGTGKVIWKNDHISQQDAGRNPLSPQGYLLCNDQYLVVPSGRSLPAVFDRQTGDELHQRTHSWRSTAGGVVGGWKALLADGQIYSAGPHHFLALDQKTGAAGFAWITGRQLTLSGDKGFVATGSQIVAIDRLKHAEATIERQKLNLQRYNLQRSRSRMKPDEYRTKDAELARRIRQLTAVGALWTEQSKSEESLILAGDRVVAGGDGRVAARDAATGKLVWQTEVQGAAGGLAASEGRLFVSTDEGHIYCFGRKDTFADSDPHRWRPPVIRDPFPKDELTPVYQQAAEKILARTDIRRGFCLLVGSEQGRLAFELAQRSKLRIYGIESDRTKVDIARRKLDEIGIYGTRVTIVHGDPASMPFSNYFANLVASDTFVLTGRLPADGAQIARCVKPCGGVACLALPDSAPGAAAAAKQNTLNEIVVAMDANTADVRLDVDSQSDKLLVRGKLADVGSWSHQYGDPANTMTSNDYRIKGGLGVLWYGDPGPSQMINRHEAAAAPLSTNGRMFVQGTDSIMCYDAYNGLFLWEYQNPGAIRTGVFNNEESSNLVASDDALFVAVDDKVTQLDAATGNVMATYETPKSTDGIPRVWGYLAYWDGALFGTSTIRSELERALRRRGHTVANKTEAIFAIDAETGKRKWSYRGKNILHVTIAIGDDRVFFIDSSITKEQRDDLLRQDKTELKKLGPEEAKKKEEELKKLDVRLAVCLDAHSGEQLWAHPVDVTDCSRVGIGGGELTLMYRDGNVVICGANANGHYWRQFLSGQFDKRRLVVLDAQTGEKRWSKDANYRHRPIIIEDKIYAEPWAFDLESGEQITRENPVTGEETAWQFSRPGHHCGPITAVPNMLFFRSGFTGYYDLYSDSGASHFAGHRLGCWVNAIPGNGLLMIPEASAGCVCQFSIASTIVMEPRENRDSWKIYSATGGKFPVKRLALNFGGPGDRRDDVGKLWLAYPRPKTVGRLEYTFDIDSQFSSGGRFFAENGDTVQVEGDAASWIFASGARGVKTCTIPLLDKDDEPAKYSVKLYFAELENAAAGERVFDIVLQGQTVASDIDIAEAAGGPNRSVIKQFDDVDVRDQLTIELRAKGELPPILHAVEVVSSP